MAVTDGFTRNRSWVLLALLSLSSATSTGCILFFHTESGGDGGAGGGSSGPGGVSATGGSGNACASPAVPAVAALPSIAALPDPFTYQDGTRMTTENDWDSRRAELGALVQQFEYGPYPPPPTSVTVDLGGRGGQSSSTGGAPSGTGGTSAGAGGGGGQSSSTGGVASAGGGSSAGAGGGATLTVTVQYGGKTVSFSPTVSLPSGSGPFPVYIGFAPAGFGAPIDPDTLTARGIASIAYDSSEISADGASVRGKGKFYDLYGANSKTGALMAWAWGVHRIVDALEQRPEFDATKVAVQGFSRWGKAALVAGAFDTRIALTLVSSSGAGGVGSWRDAQSVGSSVQTLSEAAAEANWFTQDFGQNFGCRVESLPFDGHSIVALVAPRPILVTEGSQDSWNNPKGCFNSVWAARKVFEYLGVSDHLGFRSSATSHAFSSAEEATALTFMDRFLLGAAVDTNVFDQTFPVDPNAAPWSAP